MNRFNALRQTSPEPHTSLIIATGCSVSGWESVLPILTQSGVELVDEKLAPWLDAVYQASGETSLLTVRQTLHPQSGTWEDTVASLADTDVTTCWADSRHSWLLQFWAERFPQAHFLLFYTRPITALAYALNRGLDTAQFMEGWQATNRQLLQFMRRHRKRALLLDAEAVSHDPSSFVATCNRFGLSLTVPQKINTTSVDLALERVLASHLLAGYPSAQALHLELDASALPISEVTMDALAENDQLQAQFQKIRQTHETLEITNKELTQENEALLWHLHQVQEKLERYLVRYQDLERQIVASKKLQDEQQLQLSELKNSFLGKLAFYWSGRRKRFIQARKMKAKLKRQCSLLKGSGVFNEAWYLEQYPDVAAAGMNAMEHYLRYGASEGRNPAPGFDTGYYLSANPDVASAGINPLVHYINLGRSEGRRPSLAG